ncbi:MAG: RNA-binding protein, partial [Fibrobacterota bacterium]|nr:RNA-binding protein [Fibrobacterota bacterium]
MNIYVGNLAFSVTQDELSEAFGAFGRVTSTKIIVDRETGNPRGFAFVEMADQGEALKAIQGMNGVQIQGRPISVNEARPRTPGGGGGGGGGGGFGGGGGGGGGPRGG